MSAVGHTARCAVRDGSTTSIAVFTLTVPKLLLLLLFQWSEVRVRVRVRVQFRFQIRHGGIPKRVVFRRGLARLVLQARRSCVVC